MTWPLLGQKGLSSGAFAVSFREGTILSPKSESMIFWMLRRWFFCSLEGTPYRKKNTFWILNLKIQGLVSSHDFSLFSKAVQLQVTQAVRSFSRVFSTVGSFSFDPGQRFLTRDVWGTQPFVVFGTAGRWPPSAVVTRFLSNIWSFISSYIHGLLGLPNSQPPISSNMITFFSIKVSFWIWGLKKYLDKTSWSWVAFSKRLRWVSLFYLFFFTGWSKA